MVKLSILLCLALAASPAADMTAPARDASDSADSALGQQQVEKLWTDFSKVDIDALNHFVAPGFQSLHEDGARAWPEERLLVAQLKMTPYVLSDYQVTRTGAVLLVTYQCQVGETIAAARQAKESTPRLDVFVQTADGWKLLSHVNVRKISPLPAAGAQPLMIAESRE